MEKLRSAFFSKRSKRDKQQHEPEPRERGDQRQSSLDSMNTAETGDTQETSSSVEFVDCPFLGHRYYRPVRELIRQSLGQVYLAVNKETGKEVVIKLIERGPTVSKHVESEMLLHRKCTGHPNIIQLIEVFLTPHYLAIVLEYAPGGDLLDYVQQKGRLREEEARWFFQQLVMGLAFFHSVGVDHRELNINNKLLTGDPVKPILKIQDFTYSKSEQINSDPNSALGSLPYTAPEVLTNTLRHGHQADVWSLGVALFKMVCGYFPFERPEDAADQRTAVQNVLARIAKVDYVIPNTMSAELRDLLSRMLVRQPEQRLTLAQIQAHPWFTKELPPGLLETNSRVDGNLAKQTEEELVAAVREAQQSVRVIDVDNVDELADDILAEDEVDDILEELSLANSGDLHMQC